MDNCCCGRPKSSWAPPKGMRGKCERRRGSVNADGANAEVFVGDGCSQGASFGPMALISRRGQGGRIYNNTRARELLRRKCVKPRRPHHPFPAEGRHPSPHSDTPCPSTSAPPRSPDARPPTPQHIPRRRPSPVPAAPPCLPLRSASGTKKRHRTVDVRCRMSRSTVVAVGHWGW